MHYERHAFTLPTSRGVSQAEWDRIFNDVPAIPIPDPRSSRSDVLRRAIGAGTSIKRAIDRVPLRNRRP